jgi:hypothetical protein
MTDPSQTGAKDRLAYRQPLKSHTPARVRISIVMQCKDFDSLDGRRRADVTTRTRLTREIPVDWRQHMIDGIQANLKSNPNALFDISSCDANAKT